MENKQLKSFKDLSVWQKSADLGAQVYSVTEKFPKSELYGITNQMRRAVISCSSNIAEGFKRVHKKEKLQFYNVAYGSIAELESQIEIAYKLKFLNKEDYERLLFLTVEISKMLSGLIKSLNSKSYILNSQRAQVMVEAMLAITIAVIGLLGIFSLVSRSLSLNRVVLDRYIATYLAAEGIEVVKNMIDSNVIQAKPWNQGISSGDYEIDYNDTSLQTDSARFIRYDSASGLYGYDSGDPTRFKRIIKIESSGNGEEIKINSIVNWTTRGGGSFDINLEDHFFNWRT